ncbi:MCP four helix bundle domain-containing protein [Tellurirhabdus rosea]|uniref:MCP four helix bundle domain-containing protein n=1 Tax=Tellurirhabdus rosea TaxID=2674997 RepID=UPI00225AA185|nr:MCP four helix bundle domain-containing protein [Tellurirhabdus rosea]
MKWTFFIQQKIKTALILSGVMILIIGSTFLVRRSVQQIGASFASIYADRLIPATELLYLNENFYSKRIALERHLLTENSGSPEAVKSVLRAYDRRIDSLVTEFEKSYLTTLEASQLQSFRKSAALYSQFEQRILELDRQQNRQAGNNLFVGEAGIAFQQTIKGLNDLVNLQTKVGSELLKESRGEVTHVYVLTAVQISLAVALGLIVMGLISNSRVMNRDKQPFHLN